VVRGAVGEARLENVTVDTGASYTVPGRDVVDGVGAWPIPYTVDLELEDGEGC
jgi:hypothetical protein